MEETENEMNKEATPLMARHTYLVETKDIQRLVIAQTPEEAVDCLYGTPLRNLGLAVLVTSLDNKKVFFSTRALLEHWHALDMTTLDDAERAFTVAAQNIENAVNLNPIAEPVVHMYSEDDLRSIFKSIAPDAPGFLVDEDFLQLPPKFRKVFKALLEAGLLVRHPLPDNPRFYLYSFNLD